jgi:hypothetical protein
MLRAGFGGHSMHEHPDFSLKGVYAIDQRQRSRQMNWAR